MSDVNQREDELFAAASKLSDLAQRENFLKAACQDDEPMLGRLRERLASTNEVTKPIVRPFQDDLNATVDHEESAKSGKVIAGKYKLLNSIGEGGMGTVWMAEQRAPVKRLVAIKLVKAGMDSKMVLARFEAERQALALMDHPNIARILDGGITESGSPYFVMELVKGVPITEYCDAKKLTPQQRLELFVPVCQAIQHAHQKGIIHRDIKPSNVMVSLYDDKAVPKVIDFGVAKATGQALTERTLNTGFSVVGTPQYMSPEQATFNQIDIDTRSDIYSLGVLLYELLAGSPPFQKNELENAGNLEILRIIREEEPPRPSTKLSTADGLPSLSATRSTEPKKLTGILRNELDWIVMKALEKDRSRRYETANAFASDIGRYLSGEAVQAHPPSQAYRLRKFYRKNRGAVLAASLVLLALVGGIVGTSIGLIEASRQRVIAEKAEEDALDAYRATTDDGIEQLLGAKDDYGPQEKAFLKRIIDRWMHFANRPGEDERNRAIRAEAHYRVGVLKEKLNDESSMNELQQAIGIQKLLAQEYPSRSKHLFQLAQIHKAIGIEYMDRREFKNELNECTIAFQIMESLVAMHPDKVEYRLLQSSLKTTMGSDHQMLGNATQAIADYKASIEIDQVSLRSFNQNPELLFSMAYSHGWLSTVLEESGSKSEALAEAQVGLAIIEKLAARFPERINYRQEFGLQSHGLAYALLKSGRTQDALSQYGKAVSIISELATKFPSSPTYSANLAAVTNDYGEALGVAGRHEEAVTAIEAALKIKRKYASELPKDRVYDGGIPVMTGCLIEVLINSERFEEAVLQCDENEKLLLALLGQNPDYPLNRLLLAKNGFDRGKSLQSLKREKEAFDSFSNALKTLNALIQEFPAEAKYSDLLSQLNTEFMPLLKKYGSIEESR